ncbi:3-hydroxybutyrate dehydrogenase [Kribbella shirazensis]|jgi:3-hydroxybutyrate dehydrogenase|uniref:3-hydroxybutyrate dehydrogenase n=1 Tax=Kribbella shirazensis TaxID=1105143 RepID=A0A7X5V9V8_9ACTN|nr:3-hydroxybutyrate dehydrogenase [Kribbella shirazensis]NIK57341.1 3-hydroxybutyrate dehydrogenase [Kribbella shirazensis]
METRRALVTGAASGIGAACAQRLAADGVHVVAVDLDQAGLDALDGVETVVADLSDLERLAELPTDVDILVNNAGVQQVAPVEQFPPERFSYLLRLMLEAPFRLIRQTLPHMYGAGWGRVVNISSVHGLRASPFKAAYVAAKHGLEGLSKVVALEGAAHGVTSNCVNPAYVRTPLVTAQLADQAATHGLSESEVLEKVLLEPVAVKRLIEPAEVAELVAVLCGPASASITGSSFVLDGGWTAH